MTVANQILPSAIKSFYVPKRIVLVVGSRSQFKLLLSSTLSTYGKAEIRFVKPVFVDNPDFMFIKTLNYPVFFNALYGYSYLVYV